ncbi:hypothetical protein BH20CHL6_BH20CHL6_11430 [soil metagenome]
MATQPRPEYTTRGKARLDSALPRPRLRIRLRAAFGVNARADVLAALFSNAFDRWVAQLVDSLRNPSRNLGAGVASTPEDGSRICLDLRQQGVDVGGGVEPIVSAPAQVAVA